MITLSRSMIFGDKYLPLVWVTREAATRAYRTFHSVLFCGNKAKCRMALRASFQMHSKLFNVNQSASRVALACLKKKAHQTCLARLVGKFRGARVIDRSVSSRHARPHHKPTELGSRSTVGQWPGGTHFVLDLRASMVSSVDFCFLTVGVMSKIIGRTALEPAKKWMMVISMSSVNSSSIGTLKIHLRCPT